MFTPDQVEEAMEAFEHGTLSANDALTIVVEAQKVQIAQNAPLEEQFVLDFYRRTLEDAIRDKASNVINKPQK